MMEILENNIYLGDCYKLIKGVADKSIDLIIVDPPYDIEGLHGGAIMNTRKRGHFADQLKDNNLDVGVDLSILEDFTRVLKRINIYIFCNKSQIIPYLKYFVEDKNCSFEILVWIKENPIPFCGTHYLTDKEYCLYFWEQGAPVKIPFERAKTYFLTRTNKEDKDLYEHPTIKPLEIIKTLIQNSSKQGDTVLDTFMGSGTTCVASKELGRKYIGFEINKTYFDIAKDRIEGITQKEKKNDAVQLKLF